MSTFATDWLALRESADSRARAAGLVDALADAVPADTPRRIIDLGAGTGAALRYLAPRLGGKQHWQLADADPLALGAARRVLADWGGALGAAADETPGGLAIRGTDLACRIQLVETDLAAEDFAALDWDDGAIVSASALLDLVSARWIDALVAACAARRSPAWLTLSYDGRIDIDPADALDARIRDAFNRDQRRDKGFGPALGPAAVRHAADTFSAAGFSVLTEPSDWVLGTEARRLNRALVDSYAEVAGTVEPAVTEALSAWRRRRAGEIEARALTIRVGHVDVLALPGR